LRRRQVVEVFRKLPPCLIGMEACATAHHWARELTGLGHTVRLMSASRGSAGSPSRAAATCGASSSSAQRLSSATRGHIPKRNPWIAKLLSRMPAKKVAVAVANNVNRQATLTLYRRAKLTPPRCEFLRLQARSCGA